MTEVHTRVKPADRYLRVRDSLCYLCGYPNDEEAVLDTIVPPRGNSASNIALTHRKCKEKKHGKLPHQLKLRNYFRVMRKMMDLGHPEVDYWRQLAREQKTHIGVDIDSTLYDFSKHFADCAKEHFNIEINLADEEWSTVEQAFPTREKFYECVLISQSEDKLSKNVPYEGAVEGLQKLESLGFEIVYYTDRHHSIRNATEGWLKHYGFPTPEKLNVCKNKQMELYRDMDRMVTHIDDRAKHLVAAVYNLGMPNVFGIEQGYNGDLKDLEGIHILKDWTALTEAATNVLTDYRKDYL